MNVLKVLIPCARRGQTLGPADPLPPTSISAVTHRVQSPAADAMRLEQGDRVPACRGRLRRSGRRDRRRRRRRPRDEWASASALLRSPMQRRRSHRRRRPPPRPREPRGARSASSPGHQATGAVAVDGERQVGDHRGLHVAAAPGSGRERRADAAQSRAWPVGRRPRCQREELRLGAGSANCGGRRPEPRRDFRVVAARRAVSKDRSGRQTARSARLPTMNGLTAYANRTDGSVTARYADPIHDSCRAAPCRPVSHSPSLASADHDVGAELSGTARVVLTLNIRVLAGDPY